jgi:hypothetical protein
VIAKLADVQPDDEIHHAGERLARDFGIGNQYAWLSRFCRQRGLHGVEMGAENARHGAGLILLDNATQTTSPYGYKTYRIPADTQNRDALLVFGSYAFPILELSRQDMRDIVRRNGWDALMGLTWSCHRPVHGEPCGLCNPCLYAIEQGFGARISPRRRALSAVYRVTLLPLRKRARHLMLQVRAARVAPVRAGETAAR